MADRKSGSTRQYLRAVRGFVAPGPIVVKTGQAVPADDPIVKGRESLFASLDDGIETMTRAPGEKRLTRQRPDRVVASAPATRTRGRQTSKTPPEQAEDSPEAGDTTPGG